MKKLGCFGSSCIDYYTNLQGGKAFIGGGPLNSAVHASDKGVLTGIQWTIRFRGSTKNTVPQSPI